MFSAKLICAIRLIDVLSANFSPKRKIGNSSIKLRERLDVNDKIYRTVRGVLLKVGIIELSGTTLRLGSAAEQVTLFDLMKLFHGGLPLGDVIETNYQKGGYLCDNRYLRLKELELEMEKKLRNELKSILVLKLLRSFSPTDEN